MVIGAHLSISKGYPAAARQAQALVLDGFQYFTRNPRGGRVRSLGADEIAAFRSGRQAAALKTVIAHLPYTVNLGSPEPRQIEFATMVLKEDVKRAAALGTEFVVTHPGRYSQDGVEAGLARVADVLAQGLAEAPPGPVFCLETMAGQKNEIGGTLEELTILVKVLAERVKIGLCLDTAHLFAVGWDIRTWQGIDQLVDRIENLVGWDKVCAVHLNDSKMTLGSHRDRHELIGRGELGPEGIKAIVTHPVLRELPFFLETPVDDYSQYADQAALVRELAGVGKT